MKVYYVRIYSGAYDYVHDYVSDNKCYTNKKTAQVEFDRLYNVAKIHRKYLEKYKHDTPTPEVEEEMEDILDKNNFDVCSMYGASVTLEELELINV